MIGIATLTVLFPMTNDIICDLSAIQQELNEKRKRSETARPLLEFVQFYSDTRQLSISDFSVR